MQGQSCYIQFFILSASTYPFVCTGARHMGLTPVLKDQMMWNTPKESCEVLVQHSTKAHDQHVRDLCHLSSRCECITSELGRTQETFFPTVPHRKSNRNCSPQANTHHLDTRNCRDTSSWVYFWGNSYTSRQLRKSRKWVRNKEPHMKQAPRELSGSWTT